MVNILHGTSGALMSIKILFFFFVVVVVVFFFNSVSFLSARIEFYNGTIFKIGWWLFEMIHYEFVPSCPGNRKIGGRFIWDDWRLLKILWGYLGLSLKCLGGCAFHVFTRDSFRFFVTTWDYCVSIVGMFKKKIRLRDV